MTAYVNEKRCMNDNEKSLVRELLDIAHYNVINVKLYIYI